MIEVIKCVDSYTLRDILFKRSLNTLDVIIENNKVQELMGLLEELYPEPVDITTINYLLWFNSKFVYEQLGIEVDDE